MAKVFEVAFKLGGELTSSFKNAFSNANGAMSALGAAAAAIGGAVGFGAIVSQVDQMTDSMNKLQAATGTTGAEFAELQEASLNVFKGNYGESFEEVNEALIYAKNTTGLVGKELETLTKSGFVLSDTFNYDVNESLRSSNSLMKNFGISGDESMNLIAKGSQLGLNYADDLLDSINEYSVYFDQAGLSASDMFGMFENAKNAGVFNIDYAADAFKEFGIIMTEDSTRAADALAQLGLNGNELRNQFAAGGEGAKSAFQTIATSLASVEDPLLQNILGVELFGTKFEDMGADAVMELMKVNDSFDGTLNTINEINEVRYDSFGKAIRGIGRILLVDLAYPIGQAVLPFMNQFANFLSNNLPGAIETTKSVLASITPILAGLAAGFLTYRTVLIVTSAAQTAFNTIKKISTALLYAHRTAMLAYTFAGGGVRGVIVAMRSAMAALNITMLANPFVLVASAIIGLGVALVVAYKMSDTFRAKVDAAFASVKGAALSAVNYMKTVGPQLWNGLIEGASSIGERISSFLGADLTGKAGSIASGFVEQFKAGFSSLGGIVSLIAPTITAIGLSLLGVSGPIGLVIGAVVGLVGYLYRLSKTNEGVRNALSNAWLTIQGVISSVLVALQPIFDVFRQSFSQMASELGPQFAQTGQVIAQSLASLGPTISQLGTAFAELGPVIVQLFGTWFTLTSSIATSVLPMLVSVVQMVFPMILSVIQMVLPMVIQMLTSIIPIVLQLVQTVLPLILQVVMAVFPIVLQIIQSVLPIAVSLFTMLAGIVMQIVTIALPMILQVVQMVFPIILAIIQAAIPIVTMILQGLSMFITSILIPAIRIILQVVQMVFPLIMSVIQNALAIITGVLRTFTSILQGDWSGAWNSIKATAETIMNNIISFFRGINLFDVGKKIINGLIDGIKSMGSSVIGAISGMIPKPIRGAASKLLGAIPGFAKGGVVSSPTLAWVGEGGDTETVIPWNDSKRSLDLWMQTGHAIGALQSESGIFNNNPSPLAVNSSPISGGSNASISIQSSPTIIIQSSDVDSGAVQRQVEDANRSTIAEVEEWMRNERRLAFG